MTAHGKLCSLTQGEGKFVARRCCSREEIRSNPLSCEFTTFTNRSDAVVTAGMEITYCQARQATHVEEEVRFCRMVEFEMKRQTTTEESGRSMET